MKKALLFFCLISIFCNWSCRYDPLPTPEPTLPPITQTGENTFGCYVNGELWLPKGGWMDPKLQVGYLNGQLDLRAVRHHQESLSSLRIYLGGIFSDTSFVIHNYFDSAAAFQSFTFFYAPYSENLIYDYHAISINSGEMTLLKLDTANHIMSCTFHFIGIDSVLNDTVRIEDGRFDIHYPLF